MSRPFCVVVSGYIPKSGSFRGPPTLMNVVVDVTIANAITKRARYIRIQNSRAVLVTARARPRAHILYCT
jgi:hypothetical protein